MNRRLAPRNRRIKVFTCLLSQKKPLFEKLLRPLGNEMSLEVVKAIARIKVDAETQARYEALARGANENTLSESERDELESLVRAIQS